MNVAEYLANFLVSKHVNQVFGYQGGAVLKLIDSISRTNKIQFIQNFNEQAAAFAANAQGQIRNDIGVAIATSGPGATNLITGIANAYFDSVPVMFITGQDYLHNIKNRRQARQNGFQDLNIVELVKEITKYSIMIDDPNSIKYELEKAYYYAMSGRKGPVLIDIPIDIQFCDVNKDLLKEFREIEQVEYKSKIKNIISILKVAKSPVILVGNGVRLADAIDEFSLFVDNLGIPVVTTLSGIDIYTHRIGFSGLYGNTAANLAILNSDVLLILGARLSQRQIGKEPWKYTKAKKIIHVDIDANELNRVLQSHICLKQDLKSFLIGMNNSLSSLDSSMYRLWIKKVASWKEKYKLTTVINKKYVDPVLFVNNISRYFTQKSIITSDVGQNQMWVAQGIILQKQNRLLNSAGLGSMGYSLPAAIGASYMVNDVIISFSGDGGFLMNLQELNFLSLLHRNIKCIIFNNSSLGMMREVQKRYYDENYIGTNKESFSCPNLQKLAEAFNLKYIKIENNSQFNKLARVFSDKDPWIVDVKVQYDSKLLNRYDDKALQNG